MTQVARWWRAILAYLRCCFMWRAIWRLSLFPGLLLGLLFEKKRVEKRSALVVRGSIGAAVHETAAPTLPPV